MNENTFLGDEVFALLRTDFGADVQLSRVSGGDSHAAFRLTNKHLESYFVKANVTTFLSLIHI